MEWLSGQHINDETLCAPPWSALPACTLAQNHSTKAIYFRGPWEGPPCPERSQNRTNSGGGAKGINQSNTLLWLVNICFSIQIEEMMVKAHPVPHSGVPFQPKLSHSCTLPQPFSFAERDHATDLKKRERIQEVYNEERKVVSLCWRYIVLCCVLSYVSCRLILLCVLSWRLVAASMVYMHGFTILYTALNSPSLIFTLQRSYTDSPSLEFALYLIFYIFLYI